MSLKHFALGDAIITAMIGFVFAVLGLIITQWYLRRLERMTLSAGLLMEALDILQKLQNFQDVADKVGHVLSAPKAGIVRDDMQVFLSNTGKLGLLKHGAPSYIIKFYSRVRRIAEREPTGKYVGVIPHSSPGELKAFREEISTAIIEGHAVVNSLERQVPKEFTMRYNVELSTFRSRAYRRLSEKTATAIEQNQRSGAVSVQ